jgi:hypothetical protein
MAAGTTFGGGTFAARTFAARTFNRVAIPVARGHGKTVGSPDIEHLEGEITGRSIRRWMEKQAKKQEDRRREIVQREKERVVARLTFYSVASAGASASGSLQVFRPDPAVSFSANLTHGVAAESTFSVTTPTVHNLESGAETGIASQSKFVYVNMGRIKAEDEWFLGSMILADALR